MLGDVFRKRRKASLVVMLTALAVRVLLAVVLGSYQHVNHVELDKISIALASRQGYGSATAKNARTTRAASTITREAFTVFSASSPQASGG